MAEFVIVDVFAEEKYAGNQLAVVTDGPAFGGRGVEPAIAPVADHERGELGQTRLQPVRALDEATDRLE